MNELKELRTELRRFASRLCPALATTVTPLIKIANDLGLGVSLEAYEDHLQSQRQDGELLFSSPPEIVLYRKSEYNSKVMLTPEDELMLKARERFTLAHEIGHWIAYREFGVQPIDPRSEDIGDYWRHEKVMDEFAEHILIPDWLVEDWIPSLERCTPALWFQIRDWRVQTRVSRAVVSLRLARIDNCVGFLDLAVGPRKGMKGSEAKRKMVLEVLSSAKGDSVHFPNNYKIIEHPELTNLLLSERVGSKTMCEFSFDGRRSSAYDVTWRRQEHDRYSKPRVVQRPFTVIWTFWRVR